ncbi:transglutaminase-like domain-containing protein [Rubripirellula tenax]|nr:transglutaminase-like domain-containing protein [Rubripirellula tenax]
MALLSLTAVGALRFPVESRAMFVAEVLAIAVLFIVGLFRFPTSAALLASSIGVVVMPITLAFIARACGSPIAFEMTALTTFGTASLAMAIGSRRTQAMSLVASGFLTLFAVTISDDRYAVVLAMAWMAVCVWHLVANHWERLELCAVQQVRRGTGVRPMSVLAAITLCVISGWGVRDRFAESKRFASGFMPFSGGSHWSDPAARSGVGTGDAAIAAKDHAESFGAVESDLFLESTESTLFDMFSDSIGEPKKKNKWERRQAMTPDQVLEAHAKTAKSEKGGSSFSTDRVPPKKHLNLTDATEKAVIQWAGPTGTRLAMNRYDTFDGVNWTNTANHRQETLSHHVQGNADWFMDPTVAGSFGQSTTRVNQLKVLRLDSTRIPVPMTTTGVHVKEVDRPDFFAIDDDGSFFMPGREKVPPLTVVHVAYAKVMEDELWDGLSRGQPSKMVDLELEDHRLEDYAADWTAGCDHPYEKLRAIVEHLRSEFTFDRSVETEADRPIDDFLRSRRGGDHLFATAAALLARQIGLQSRLVTGFYVRPSAFDVSAGHTNVLPDDVHVWTEVRLDDGRWFEIEPTPGYRQPIYTPSVWLVAAQLTAAYWPHAIAWILAAGLLFATRLFWIELGLVVVYPIGAIVWPKKRTALAMRVLQTRARVAGCPRIAGRPQRDWLLAITATHQQLRDAARQFCDAADRAAFAGTSSSSFEHNASKELLMNLKIRVFRQLCKEESA